MNAAMRDLATLYHLMVRPVRGGTHAQRLESFYGPQAEGYDDFRQRLLHGREALFRSLPLEAGQTWIDMGGATGASIGFMGERAAALERIHIVDLSPSLLNIARKRVSTLGLTNVALHEADVTTFVPDGGPVDLVTFSYSLTMIPNWFAALEHALRLLKPGGHIGVVDFYVSRKYVAEGHRRHSAFTRHFWPAWFANDNVFLNADHLPWLAHAFETIHLAECRGGLPFVPLAKVPHYGFVGRKRRMDQVNSVA
ncbi:MAG: class I SAM-dependent methyltransferase [Candidatus Hydrogenedentes bacterium]|nr:class I SAM-dependent methyltransferase [Candidatus Hydrogenedentota bacterium]